MFNEDIFNELALLYLKQQDLSGKSPEEIIRMYRKAYIQIKEASHTILDEEKKARRDSNVS